MSVSFSDFKEVAITTHKHKVVVFRLGSKILEDALLPEAFHVIPVLNQAVLDWLIHLVGLGIGISLITDEEVKIFNASLGCQRRARAQSTRL